MSSENVFARLERYLVRQATTPPSAAHWGERLMRRLWRPPVKHPGVNPPASAADLAAFEQTFSVALPDDVIRSYRHMNGTEDYTDLEAGWLRFWPIEEWKPVAHEFPGDPSVTDEPLSESFVCADHGISAWFFAIDLSPTRLGRVYSLVPAGAVLVALSFTEFVERALENPDELFRY